MTNNTFDEANYQRFRWLHFSDLHVGAPQQDVLWPSYISEFRSDLLRLLDAVGKIDLIVFSGDLVYKGEAAEFNRFDAVIDDLISWISSRQTSPQVISVPGNHDLSRPNKMSPYFLALSGFWGNSEMQKEFWGDGGAEYRDFLKRTFENYSTWRQRAIARGVHARPVVEGLLPGDASYLIASSSGQAGVVALNSSWLQLGNANYEGELHVDPHQFFALVGDNPVRWLNQNFANLLITHQPASWLRKIRPFSWDNDINPPGRFDAHLFGHMHEPDTTAIRHGGSVARINIQAASLFGLTKYADGRFDRIQGYSANEIYFDKAERFLKSWPRRLIFTTSGRGKIERDLEQDLDESTGAFLIPIEGTEVNHRNFDGNKSDPSTPLELAAANSFNLDAIRLNVGDHSHHQNVRRIEQETVTHELFAKRVAWVAADWGMGFDGFVGSICSRLNVSLNQVFSLDFSGYSKREAFFDAVRTLLNATFPQICEAISEAGPALLIFDEIDLSSRAVPSEIDRDLEDLASAISDFAQDTFVIIHTKRPPKGPSYSVIELLALDEADTQNYIADSNVGGAQYTSLDAISKLYRHTDGVPARIDEALRNLEVVSLGELIAANPDFGDLIGAGSGAPPALVASIQEIKNSEDRSEQRSYELLLALAALPQGEQLGRLRRFLGPHQFGPIHARILLERSLISTSGLSSPDANTDPTSKLLIVPRPVRDYIRENLDPALARGTDRKALELFFGDKWQMGSIHSSAAGRRLSTALCDGYEIQNAATVIIRNSRRSLDAGGSLDIESALRLALAFAEILKEGDHYRAAASFCEDMVRLLSEYGGYESETTKLNYHRARCLRMCGRLQETEDVIRNLDPSHLSKSERQTATLNIALCHEQNRNSAALVLAAQDVIAIDAKSATALHAKTILAGQIEDDALRFKEQDKLLRAARARKAYTLVHNIELDRAHRQAEQGHDPRDLLLKVFHQSRSERDFYNSARAIVELASLPEAEHRLTSQDKLRLVEAYHFLYDERLGSLFDRCHEALWRVFELDGDRPNLLNLFRRSSFIWRLSGRANQETLYLSKLMQNMQDLISMGISQSNRDGAYMIVRITVVTGTAIADLTGNEKADVNDMQ